MNAPQPVDAKQYLTKSATERTCNSCCFCGCGCCFDTCYWPKDFASCIGCTTHSLCLCEESELATCISPRHPSFDEIVSLGQHARKSDVCCILYSKRAVAIKPLWITGEKPLCKSISYGACCCCRGTRCACPFDNAEVPCICSCLGLSCCTLCGDLPVEWGFACCKPIPELPADRRGLVVDVVEPRVGDEYILCACGPSLFTVFMPETYYDALGSECNSTSCCCCRTLHRGHLLPKAADDNILGMQNECQVQCVKPPCVRGGACEKDVCRCSLCICKSAFPCDQEVPCGCSYGPCKCCQCGGGHPCGCCQCCKRDPHTGQIIRLAKLTKKKNAQDPAQRAQVNPQATVGVQPMQMQRGRI